MGTWSLTEVDKTDGLAATSCSRRVIVDLGVSPRAAPLSVPLDDSGQAPGGLKRWPQHST